VPLAAEGEFALSREQLETALTKKFVARSDRVTTPGGDHDLYVWLADVAAQQLDGAALEKYAPKAEETALRCGHRLYQAIAHRAWGVTHRLAARYAEAEAQMNKALALFNELDTRWQLGRTLLECGELAKAQGHAGRARDYFSRALTAFEFMGAEPMVSHTHAQLATLPA
jgi:hypothetical protein